MDRGVAGGSLRCRKSRDIRWSWDWESVGEGLREEVASGELLAALHEAGVERVWVRARRGRLAAEVAEAAAAAGFGVARYVAVVSGYRGSAAPVGPWGRGVVPRCRWARRRDRIAGLKALNEDMPGRRATRSSDEGGPPVGSAPGLRRGGAGAGGGRVAGLRDRTGPNRGNRSGCGRHCRGRVRSPGGDRRSDRRFSRGRSASCGTPVPGWWSPWPPERATSPSKPPRTVRSW